MTTVRLTLGKARPLGGGRAKAGSALRVATLLVFALFFAGPVVWLILAPTKERAALFRSNPYAFGSIRSLSHTASNLFSYNHGEIFVWLLNSVVYTVASLLIAVLVCIPAGYALAKYDFPGRKLLLTATLIAMMVPVAALVLPLFLEMHVLGLIGSPLSVIVPLGLYPFGVYLAYVYYRQSLPNSLLESARIDGAGEFGVFRRVAVPLSKPLAALLGFLAFVHIWNNFFLPFVMLNDDRSYTLQVGLMNLLQSTGAINPEGGLTTLPIHEPEAALAAIFTVFPVLVVYLFAQRFVVAGQLAGADKG